MNRFAFVLTLLIPLIPLAQPAETPDEGLRKFSEGRALYQQGKYLEALERMREAYAIDPNPMLLYNIARCSERLGNLKEAVQSYHRYLERDPSTRVRAKVEALIKTLSARLPGEIEVASQPPGARVRLDGKEVGVTPCSLEAPKGRHEIALIKEGFVPSTLALEVKAGERMVLSPKLAVAPKGKGPPKIIVEPPAQRDWMPSTWSWVTMGTGVATVVTGAILGGLASAQKGDTDRLLEGAQTLSDLEGVEATNEGAHSRALAANVMYVAGAAIVAAGVLVWFLSPQRSPEEAPAVSLGVGPAGASAMGRF